MAKYQDIGSSGGKRGVVEATAVVCELFAMTVGNGGKVSGVTPRSGDGWDMSESSYQMLNIMGYAR